MSGRYGLDEFFYVLFVIATVLSVVNCIVRSIWLQFVVYAIIVYAFFRVMSRNTEARRRENLAFVKLKTGLINKRSIRRQRKADYSHIYKKCPNCRAVLRLPRRKGKHTTVCPKCNKEFKVRVFKA